MNPENHELLCQYNQKILPQTEVPVLEEILIRETDNAVLADYNIAHTKHSYQRSLERDIGLSELLTVLDFGIQIQKQQLVFHVAATKNLPDSISEKIRRRTQNLVVVTNSDQSVIITCYRSKNGSRRIRKKTKHLL